VGLAAVVAVVSVCDDVLAGMIAAGLGAEAIAAYLDVETAELFDRAARLGLTAPHDRLMRRRGGKHAWTLDDSRHLIALWMAGVRVRCIADALERSPSAIYCRRRRLGLPSRDRRGLRERSIDACRATPRLRPEAWGGVSPDIRPTGPNGATSAGADRAPQQQAGSPASTRASTDRPSKPRTGGDAAVGARGISVATLALTESPAVGRTPVDAASQPVVLPAPGRDRRKPREATPRAWRRASLCNLTEEQKIDIEHRGLAGQRSEMIAAELGVTYSQVVNRLLFTEVSALRKAHKIPLVHDYDPTLMEKHKKAHALFRKAMYTDERFWGFFWTSHNCVADKCERLKKSKRYQNAIAAYPSH